MAGNNRNFGALTFRRKLKAYILGGGHKIPLQASVSVTAADDKLEPDEPVFDEPLLSKEVYDELWNKDDQNEVVKISTNAPLAQEQEDDCPMDDTVCF